MTNYPYHLHAIIIHNGKANDGHYYSFIYDRAAKLWYRFNDHTVSKEAEDIVFSEAYGG
jgi:ubiquitin carboxyl-terminal hydrolase 25/28